MSNIAISEINSTTDYIKNDDLFLVSSSNHSNNNSLPNSYTSSKINGLNLKINASMPPIENLKKFSYSSITTTEMKRETVQVSGNLDRYVAYYSVTLPVSCYVEVRGNFIMSKSFMNTNRTADQYLAIRFRNDRNEVNYATLCTHTCGYVDTDDNNIWKGIQLSYWIGYVKAGTEFIMHSKLYSTAEAREAFINGIYDDSGNNWTRLTLKYWTPTVIQ